MKATTTPSTHREVRLEGDLGEFVEIYFACNPPSGRRTKRQKHLLEKLAKVFADADPILADQVARRG